MRPRRRLRLAIRRVIPIVTVPVLFAGTLAAASVPARPAVHESGSAPSPGGAGSLLSARQASARARATGRPVVASALTTPTAVTTARPDGQFVLDESAVPVRAWHNGAWASLDPTLHRGTSGKITPAVTTSPLALSGGGSGPLAVMTTDARTLTLSWPGGPLPSPIISGATATYPDVLPGVDLAVTADGQGGFSDVFIVKNAAAAANPALASLKLTVTTPGLILSADSGGSLRAAPTAQGVPVFTAGPPRVWDSAPAPAGMPTVTAPDGTIVNAQNGLPASSSAAAPGSGAHTGIASVSVSGSTITLGPPAPVLTGSSTVYPVYIDPTWWPAGSNVSAWTEVESGYPNSTGGWKQSSDLQSGDCYDSPPGSCNGIGVARSFLRLPIPSQLTTESVINKAYLYTTEKWAPSCAKYSVRLYTTGVITSSTSWNNQPNWASGYSYQDAAFGYSSSCAYYKDDVTWDVTSTISGDIGARTTQTWGLRAADETNTLAWKQFFSGASSTYHAHMTVYYNDPPNSPGSRATSPGGSCQHTASSGPVIGNDDVTFSGYTSDPDGDNNLTTQFLILNSSGKTVYDSNSQGTSVKSGNGTTAQLTLTRTVMQGLQTNGTTTAYTYHWYAITTDDNGLTSPNPVYECYFTYNPNAAGAPTITVPSTGAIGQQVAASFTAPAGCSTTSTCPATYTYQLGANSPVTVSATSNNWSDNITMPRVGPMLLTVYGTASNGDLSEAATVTITGIAPASPYNDADLNGDGKPDLLTLGTGSDPSLWLAPGTGNGTLGKATDIGGQGTGLNAGGGSPADWTGTVVTHGDFTENHVQDVMAYYPTGSLGGGAVIFPGTGDGKALQVGTAAELPQGTFYDPLTGDYPFTLVAAGNASQAGTGTADLIGIAGDTVNNYELDLFTDTVDGKQTGYGYTFPQVLSAQSPDGATPSDWNNFTLATAQPGNNPSATVLFALNTTGALYESTNPSQSASSIIGTGNWQQITVPWGSAPPALLSGDVNSAGQVELWGRNGSTLTAYTLSGTTLSSEHANTLTQSLADWPLAEGTGTATAETITAQNATLTGGATWITSDISQFGNHIELDGTGYISPPASAIPVGSAPPSISIWFKTTTPGGVLVSMQKSALSSGGALPSQYDPVLYIGSDGKLYGEWWNGSASPAASTTIVDDGNWHHAVLTATSTNQTLYLDGTTQQTLSGATSFQFTPTNPAFGAGYIGGPWPNEPNYQKSGLSDYRQYFNGEIADATYG